MKYELLVGFSYRSAIMYSSVLKLAYVIILLWHAIPNHVFCDWSAKSYERWISISVCDFRCYETLDAMKLTHS